MDALFNALFGGGARAEVAGADADAVQELLKAAAQPRVATSIVKGSATELRAVAQTSAGASQGGVGTSGDVEQQPLLAEQRQPLRQKSLPGGTLSAAPAATAQHTPQWLLTTVYGLTNLSSVVMIVVANKMVLFTHKFSFVVTLTLLHSLFTAVGMTAMAAAGLFQVKKMPVKSSMSVAAVYVGFIIFNNLSIQLNPLGFYQMSKLAITPVVVAIEWVVYSKKVSGRILLSIAILLVGITLCSVTDTQVSSNPAGIAAAVGSVLVAALYQIWAGTKQVDHGVNGMQLLQQVSPYSVALLAVLIPMFEPIGWADPKPGTLMGYVFTPEAAAWIGASSVLGLVVTLSTFLFIGATSSLTYNVVGHLKTILIVAAGMLFFHEEMGLKKGAGLLVAMCGIVWYSQIKFEESRKPEAKG